MEIPALRHLLLAYTLSVVRLTAAAQVSPFFGGQLLSGPVRNSVMFALGLVVFPMIYPTVPEDLSSPILLLGILIKEVVLGILLGYVASIPFWAAESVGFFIDNQRGASMSTAFDPFAEGEVSPLGIVLHQSLIVLFHTTGGFLLFLGTIYESYEIWPLVAFLPELSEAFPGMFLELTDQLMLLMVVLAAPVVITMFLTEFGLGLVNRFAPQLNVFFLAMPVKSAVGVFVLVAYLPFLIDLLTNEFRSGQKLLTFVRGAVP